MAVLLCFYANKYPGATNTYATSCRKQVLFGINTAIPPFLAQVGKNLQNHLLINKGMEFGYTNLWRVTGAKISTWAAWKEQGREGKREESPGADVIWLLSHSWLFPGTHRCFFLASASSVRCHGWGSARFPFPKLCCSHPSPPQHFCAALCPQKRSKFS